MSILPNRKTPPTPEGLFGRLPLGAHSPKAPRRALRARPVLGAGRALFAPAACRAMRDSGPQTRAAGRFRASRNLRFGREGDRAMAANFGGPAPRRPDG